MALGFQEPGGPIKGADFKRFVETLTLAQKMFLAAVLELTQHGDFDGVRELYAECANNVLDADPRDREKAAEEGNDRFFTVEAHERLSRLDEEAAKIGREKGLIETRRGNGRIIKP